MTRTEEWSARYPEWNNWIWQVKHRITNVETLSRWFPLSEQEKKEIGECLKSFRMGITPYYLSLVDPDDPDDPIKKECIPSIRETLPCVNDLTDPLNEDGNSPVPHLVHRYPDRVLLLVTLKCSMYCRHCTRRRLVGEEDRLIPRSGMCLFQEAIHL